MNPVKCSDGFLAMVNLFSFSVPNIATDCQKDAVGSPRGAEIEGALGGSFGLYLPDCTLGLGKSDKAFRMANSPCLSRRDDATHVRSSSPVPACYPSQAFPGHPSPGLVFCALPVGNSVGLYFEPLSALDLRHEGADQNRQSALSAAKLMSSGTTTGNKPRSPIRHSGSGSDWVKVKYCNSSNPIAAPVTKILCTASSPANIAMSQAIPQTMACP
ncbi:hypothetical protein [Borborobacter arsenicus]|uniref:hypothetical protein n=1 Tax=Borborobacter arsenicus TaxID=1851146 RepID=UPI0014053C60|nr:hypothetical protein [Pseudaminobacter arsenicus]